MTPASVAAVKRDAYGGRYAACCGGDGCDSLDPWPLHHVRHRSAFLRLCTSCVLRYHPGSFCTACFDLLHEPSPDRPIIYCANCPAVAHLTCLPDPSLAAEAQYLCPLCSTPHGFSYFPADRPADEENPARCRYIDLSSAKVLLAASQLATASMNRAVASARAEAERKAREAAVASKRAREMLDRTLLISKTETEEVKRVAATSAVLKSARTAEMKKKKIPRNGGTSASDVLAHKKFQDRQTEKFMMFLEPTQMAHQLSAQGIAGNDANKVPAVKSVHNRVSADLKGQVASMAPPHKHVKQDERDEETNRLSPNFQDATIVKEEEKRPAVEEDSCLRMPQPIQDVPDSKTNSRYIATCPPNTTRLHS